MEQLFFVGGPIGFQRSHQEFVEIFQGVILRLLDGGDDGCVVHLLHVFFHVQGLVLEDVFERRGGFHHVQILGESFRIEPLLGKQPLCCIPFVSCFSSRRFALHVRFVRPSGVSHAFFVSSLSYLAFSRRFSSVRSQSFLASHLELPRGVCELSDVAFDPWKSVCVDLHVVRRCRSATSSSCVRSFAGAEEATRHVRRTRSRRSAAAARPNQARLRRTPSRRRRVRATTRVQLRRKRVQLHEAGKRAEARGESKGTRLPVQLHPEKGGGVEGERKGGGSMCPGCCRWDTVGEREVGWLGHDRVIPREIPQVRNIVRDCC